MDNETKSYLIEKYGNEIAEKYEAYEADYTAREKELMNKINGCVLNELFVEISKHIGQELDFKSEWKNIRGKEYLECSSNDFANANPVIAAAWREFKVVGSGSVCHAIRYITGTSYDKENPGTIDYTQPADVKFVIRWSFSYQHHGLGQNGADIASAWYDGAVWTIKYESEKF